MRARDILEGDPEKGKKPIPVEEIASNIGYRKTLAISVVGLELSEKLVLSFIAGAGAHYSGFACLYGQQTIAEELGIGLRSVKRAYQTLLERGLISYQMGADGERYKNPDYREPKKKDPRSRIVYLGFEQLLIQANTETGKEYYRAYQQKKEQDKQAKKKREQESQTAGQKEQAQEAQTGQLKARPQVEETRPPAPACREPVRPTHALSASFLQGLEQGEYERRKAEARAELDGMRARNVPTPPF